MEASRTLCFCEIDTIIPHLPFTNQNIMSLPTFWESSQLAQFKVRQIPLAQHQIPTRIKPKQNLTTL